jgi:hypothetical protein
LRARRHWQFCPIFMSHCHHLSRNPSHAFLRRKYQGKIGILFRRS